MCIYSILNIQLLQIILIIIYSVLSYFNYILIHIKIENMTCHL